jgi:hypothetical protein
LEQRAAASVRKRRDVDLDVDDDSSSKPTTNGLLVLFIFDLIYLFL